MWGGDQVVLEISLIIHMVPGVVACVRGYSTNNYMNSLVESIVL